EQMIEVRWRIAFVEVDFGAIGDPGAGGGAKRIGEKLAAQERIENVGDRRVAPRLRLGERFQDAVARQPPGQTPREPGERRAPHAEGSGDALLSHPLDVVAVAAEHFVRALAGEHDRDAPPCILGEQHGRQRRLIAERFVEYADPSVERGKDLAGSEHQAMMSAADMARDLRGLFVFAANGVADETEIEAVDRLSRNTRGDRGNDAGIDAAAYEGAKRYVGDQHRF